MLMLTPMLMRSDACADESTPARPNGTTRRHGAVERCRDAVVSRTLDDVVS